MTRSDEVMRLCHKAEQDRAVFRVIRDHPEIDANASCFHAQQAIEKWLKAVLVSKGISPRRTHDLDTLVDRILDEGIEFPFSPDRFSCLTAFAVQFRYEELDAEAISLAEVEGMIEDARTWAMTLLHEK
ncbi:MAG: HEPN domain-containing protein [Magnetococcus sp. YQC-9]